MDVTPCALSSKSRRRPTPHALSRKRRILASRAAAPRPDTPLEDVIISWVDDPDGRFTVDATRTAEGNENFFITVTGSPDFVGTGRVVIRVADPLAPSVLFEEQTFFFTSAEALPPSVFPDNIKVPTEPGGVWTNSVDDFVSDPDNIDSDLFWSIPSGTTTTIGIDAERLLSVGPPDDFHGYEEVQLTVSDPGGQSDVLTLRIYSSDGRPVTGGLPNLILDRGAQHREFDLDDYYHDSNNSDEQMVWRAQPTFDENNLSIFIDPLTHIVTYSASPNASFGTETVVFRVTDTDGESSQDTMLVTIQAGGGDSGGAFQIIPDLPPLQAQVGQATQVIDNLNDFIVTTPDLPRSSITWELADDGNNGIAGVSRRTDTSHPDGVRWVLTVFGEASGIDTRGISQHGPFQSIYFRDPNGYVVELTADNDQPNAEQGFGQQDPHQNLNDWQASRSDRCDLFASRPASRWL